MEAAFCYLNLDWRKYVKVDKKFLRPVDIQFLLGDASKARKELKWKPKVGFKEMVEMMVDEDIRLLSK